MSAEDRPGEAATMMLLHGGSVWADSAFEKVDVLVAHDRIVGVGTDTRPEEQPVERIDCSGLLILPGLCNAHTHTNNVLARSMMDVGSLESLINIGPAANLNRTAEETYLAAALNAVEMLRTGCTSCCDGYTNLPALSLENLDAVACAYSDVGLRVTIALQYTDLSFHDSLPGLGSALPPGLADEVERRKPRPVDMALMREAVERWDGACNGRIRVALGPSIPQLCSDDLLEQSIALSRECGVPIHTHLAESRVETSTSLARFAKGVVEHLAELEFLTPQTLLAHGVWLSDRDLDIIGASGAIIAHAPGSNLRLGCGVARVMDMLRNGITVGVGTDGSASSDNQNMFEAMRLAAVSSRVRSYDEADWLSAEGVLRMTTENTAAILGVDTLLGAVKTGYKADLTLVDSSSIYLTPSNDVVAQLVLSEIGTGVRSVIVDGKFVMRDRVIQSVDEMDIIIRANEAAMSLRERNRKEWRLVKDVAPFVRERSLHVINSMPWTNDESLPSRSMFAV